MKRVERIFQLILLMQEGNVLTSQYLSKKLGVSTRTVHRDIGDLVSSGILIEGQPGVGFLLRGKHRLPSITFTNDELQALALGTEMVRMWSDRALGNAGETAIQKLKKILPKSLKAKIHLNGIEVHGVQMSQNDSEKLNMVRASIAAEEKLNLSYSSRGEIVTNRIIRPLMINCLAGIWSVGAWCELRGGFRTFQVDRIVQIKRTKETFELTADCNHQAYLTCPKRHRSFWEQNDLQSHDESKTIKKPMSSSARETKYKFRKQQHETT